MTGGQSCVHGERATPGSRRSSCGGGQRGHGQSPLHLARARSGIQRAGGHGRVRSKRVRIHGERAMLGSRRSSRDGGLGGHGQSLLRLARAGAGLQRTDGHGRVRPMRVHAGAASAEDRTADEAPAMLRRAWRVSGGTPTAGRGHGDGRVQEGRAEKGKNIGVWHRKEKATKKKIKRTDHFPLMSGTGGSTVFVEQIYGGVGGAQTVWLKKNESRSVF